MDKEALYGHAAVAAAYVIFGLNIIVNKGIANYGQVPPEFLFALRSGVTCVVFWIMSLILPEEKVAARDLPKIAAASFLGLFVPQMTFLLAITMATTIDTSILGSLGPIFTMIFAFIFLKEPITVKKVGGVALSFSGALFLIFNSVHTGGADATTPLGAVLLLLNSLSFSLYLGIFRPLISRYSVTAFMKWMFLFSFLMSLPFSCKSFFTIDYQAIPATVLWEIAFLVIFATVFAYLLIPYGQKRIRPTLVSMYSYLQPIIAAVVSVIIGMDRLGWQKVLAIVMVFGGVVLVNSSKSANKLMLNKKV